MAYQNILKLIHVRTQRWCVSKRSATSFRCNLPRINRQMSKIWVTTSNNWYKRLFYRQNCKDKFMNQIIKVISTCQWSSRTYSKLLRASQKSTPPRYKLVRLNKLQSKSPNWQMLILNLPISVKRLPYKWSWKNWIKLRMGLIKTPRTSNLF